MKIKKRLVSLFLVLTPIMFLVGCGSERITEENAGFFNSWLTIPLSTLLTKMQVAFGSYGVAIIILTCLIKILLFPLTLKEKRSGLIMQKLKPQLERLREEYKDEPQKFQVEQMKLLKENGAQLLGCSLSLVQLVVTIALFAALSPTTAPDPEIANASFLYLERLGDPDPYYLFPMLAVLTAFFQSASLQVNPDDKQSKIMRWLFPLIMVPFVFGRSVALPIYFATINLLSFFESKIIKRLLNG